MVITQRGEAKVVVQGIDSFEKLRSFSTGFGIPPMMNARTAVSDHPGGMDDDTLAAAVATLAAHIHAATSRLLVLIAELDRRKLWAAQGAMSCAHWLGWACGIDAHTAREKVQVARALENFPLLSEALAKGELGYSKVRALTRVATARNEALGLAIDGRTATARWDGVPVDYDQGIMVAMASWGPANTRAWANVAAANGRQRP